MSTLLTLASPYPIIEVDPESVIGDEPLGSKDKCWFLHDKAKWLFKEARVIPYAGQQLPTGEDWAEKVAAEVAHLMRMPAAEVELATLLGRRGCASKNFVVDTSHHLMHGNEVLAGYVTGYDRNRWQRQPDHSLENIIRAIRTMFPADADHRTVLVQLASYLVLDALVGNVDRHHENWGLLWQVHVEPDDLRERARLNKVCRALLRPRVVAGTRTARRAEDAPFAQ